MSYFIESMKLRINWPLIGIIFSIAPCVWADAGHSARNRYGLDWSAGSSVAIRVPYSVGTHDVAVQDMKGEVDVEAGGKATGHFTIPLTSLDTGSSARDCHMREGLGLDYTKSKYPGEHICNSENLLDESQIVYPSIEFDLENVSPPVERAKLTADGKDVHVLGKWSIHGVTKEFTFPATISFTGGDRKQILLDTTIPIRLKDFGIVIKKAFVISVADEISAHIHLIFAPLKPGEAQPETPSVPPPGR
jgi:polyisoprenoid-binding protein YceI